MIVIVVVVLGIVFVAVSFFMRGEPQDDPLLQQTTTARPDAIVGQEIITALNQIETLKLSRDIFSNEVYKRLRDKSQPIPPEDVGKPNPFDPLKTNNNAPAARTPVPQIRETPTGQGSIIKSPASQPVI